MEIHTDIFEAGAAAVLETSPAWVGRLRQLTSLHITWAQPSQIDSAPHVFHLRDLPSSLSDLVLTVDDNMNASDYQACPGFFGQLSSLTRLKRLWLEDLECLDDEGIDFGTAFWGCLPASLLDLKIPSQLAITQRFSAHAGDLDQTTSRQSKLQRLHLWCKISIGESEEEDVERVQTFSALSSSVLANVRSLSVGFYVNDFWDSPRPHDQVIFPAGLLALELRLEWDSQMTEELLIRAFAGLPSKIPDSVRSVRLILSEGSSATALTQVHASAVWHLFYHDLERRRHQALTTL